jgi:hypothetical protein
MSLGEVIRDTGQVIHVAMGDTDDVTGQCEIRATADVKTDVQFGDLDHAFFAGDAITDDVD